MLGISEKKLILTLVVLGIIFIMGLATLNNNTCVVSENYSNIGESNNNILWPSQNLKHNANVNGETNENQEQKNTSEKKDNENSVDELNNKNNLVNEDNQKSESSDKKKKCIKQ